VKTRAAAEYRAGTRPHVAPRRTGRWRVGMTASPARPLQTIRLGRHTREESRMATRLARRLVVCGLLVLAWAAAVARADPSGRDQRQESLPSLPARLAEMQHHYVQVTLIHEAIIRGDLPAIQAPARALAAMSVPVNTPAETAYFAKTIVAAAEQAAGARTLPAAATATTQMLLQCGECHRAAGVFPAPARMPRPDLGSFVGHMLEHQRAADALLHGLVVPSASRWMEGASRLKTTPLRESDLPRDPAFTEEIRRSEARVHAMANRAAQATTGMARAAVYADLLTTCAQCHGLHREIWGPRRQSTAQE
jgi:mono/diheme cytochrome c family protein